MTLFDIIWGVAKAAWNYIVKLFVSVCVFARNIYQYFCDHDRNERLKNPDIIAVSVRKHLKEGNYNVVNCLFDKVKQSVVDPEDMEVITADSLDEETMEKFGKNDLLVLNLKR